MPRTKKVEVDPAMLAKMVADAVRAAMADISPPKPPKTYRQKSKPTHKSEKDNVVILDEKIIADEPIEEILNYKPVPTKAQANVVSAKPDGWNERNSSLIAPQPVNIKNRKMQFFDSKSVEQDPEGAYAPPSERDRPHKQKMDFRCNNCGRAFQAYPSEVHKAFISFGKIDGVEDKPRIRCNNCENGPSY